MVTLSRAALVAAAVSGIGLVPAAADATIVSYDFTATVYSGSYDARLGTLVTGTLTYDTDAAVLFTSGANETYYQPSGASLTFSYQGATYGSVNYSGDVFHSQLTADVMSKNGLLISNGQPVFFTTGTAISFHGTIDTPNSPFGAVALSLGMSSLIQAHPTLPDTLPTLANFGTPSVASFSFASTSPGTKGQAIANLTSFQPARSAVPEPATWAMMLVGFGILGGALRRERGSIALA